MSSVSWVTDWGSPKCGSPEHVVQATQNFSAGLGQPHTCGFQGAWDMMVSHPE
jgi:hypothetical protein